MPEYAFHWCKYHADIFNSHKVTVNLKFALYIFLPCNFFSESATKSFYSINELVFPYVLLALYYILHEDMKPMKSEGGKYY